MKRRDFLKAGAAAGAGALLGAGAPLRAMTPPTNPTRVTPMVVSTWSHGQFCNQGALQILQVGGTAVDAVELGVSIVESDPKCDSVGYGGLPNAEGVVQLDAAIMNGSSLEAGAVAALERIKNPIRVARKVMEESPHVMLVGDGARRFAAEFGIREEDLLTEDSKKKWEAWKQSGAKKLDGHDTIGAIAIDRGGQIAAACTTSGLAWKLPGRVGDSPIVGAGLYADSDVGACVATGWGEEILKVCGSFLVVELMRQGRTPEEAVVTALDRMIARDGINRRRLSAFLAVRMDGMVGYGSTTPGFQVAISKEGNSQLIDAPSRVAPNSEKDK
ncbi:MAG: N(4)-(beta-N-acetylglucosaminyl)-L-asparaginase [Planctomycetes bacterium]|nr:N(4)-(beta-N-acetylglucosaminyl)-L-asparaginase [Planctomycetota bacterium]